MLSKHMKTLVPNVCKHVFPHNTSRCGNKISPPILQGRDIFRNDIKYMGSKPNQSEISSSRSIPSHTDILVIGGGIMGTSAAYWLKEKSNSKGLSVTVLEKDPKFTQNSTVLSVGGIRQQFSLPENIQMSLFGADFLNSLKRRFGPDADISYTPNGYMTLAGEKGVQQLLDNHKIQKDLGACNVILNKEQLKNRFPWLNTANIELGCLGLEKEGWFDPWSLLNLMKKGAADLGTEFIHGELMDFVFTSKNSDVQKQGVSNDSGINEAIIGLPNGEKTSITFDICIIAAGGESKIIAQKAKIGTGEGLLSVSLPVERRKRYVFNFVSQGEVPGRDAPLTIDKTGAYFRIEGLGNGFIGGMSPPANEEPDTDHLEVDYNYFDETLWPILADRIPAFNSLKIRSAWGGYYEYNTFDMNGIIGRHPYYNNFFLATGFSGHGIQQAPAVGHAIAELILYGKYRTIDLTRLGFDRIVTNNPMFEVGIV